MEESANNKIIALNEMKKKDFFVNSASLQFVQ